MNELIEVPTTQAAIIMPPERKQSKETAIIDNSPAGLLRLGIDKNLDIDKLRELMNLEKAWRADKAKAAFNFAMAQFNAIKPTIKHNRKGKTAGSAPFSYADFPAMVSVITPLLASCGLSFTHRLVKVADGDDVICKISHQDGHSEDFPYPVLIDSRLEGKVSPMQLRQLSITYAKRQTLAAGLGLATAEDKDDDDASKPVDRITENQAADLVALMDECHFNKPKFLKWLEVSSIEELDAEGYKKALEYCEKARKEGKKA